MEKPTSAWPKTEEMEKNTDAMESGGDPFRDTISRYRCRLEFRPEFPDSGEANKIQKNRRKMQKNRIRPTAFNTSLEFNMHIQAFKYTLHGKEKFFNKLTLNSQICN
ncbi:hypothetical protein SLE2022_315110 [Rubroshorea leprosula]